MNGEFSDDLLARFAGWVADQLGLHFGPERRSDLQRGLEAARQECGFEDVAAFLTWLMAGPLSRQQTEVLARHLTVGETYFFRDKRGWEILETEVLPPLLQTRRQSDRRLRLWSAGCATGEEPYTLAILLTRMIPDWPDWAITILGTDINPQALEHAAQAEYGEWSFRDAPSWLKDGCFRQVAPGRYRLDPRVRRLVTFTALNLASDVYPSLLSNTNAMDVIVCRNVMLYFSPEQACKAVSRLHRCLVEGGWLVGSPTEGAYLSGSGLTPVFFPGAILYRKATAKPAAGGTRAAKETKPAIAFGHRLSQRPGKTTANRPRPLAASVRAASEPADNAAAVFQRALDAYREGRSTEAAAALERLAAQQPDSAEACDLLTRLHADQGKLDQALLWSDRAIAADKLNPQHHYLRATILQELGQWEQAAASLQRALYLDHEFVVAHFALGSLTLRRGQAASARRHFANALELLAASPADAIVPASEGVTAGRLREIIAAMAALEANP